MRLHTTFVLLAAIAMFSTSAEAREWSDSTGRHRTEAELVKHEDDKVWFKDTAGRSRSVDFERLSAADQAYVMEHERQSANQEPSVKKQDLVVNTLSYRIGQQRPAAKRMATKLTANAQAATSLFKLAGWSYCTSANCHHPHPHPPAPPKPPLPKYGKRIYHGGWSTWHLVRLQNGPTGGTGSYLLTEGGAIVRHLVLLKYVNEDRTYWYFEADDPKPGFKYWRFSNLVVGSCYRVEYSADGKTYYVYEYCRVKLPV